MAAPSAPLLSVIQASVGTAIHLVPVGDVIYFEAADKYVRVVAAQRAYLRCKRSRTRRLEAPGRGRFGYIRCSCPPSNFTRSPTRRSSTRWKSRSRTPPLSKRTVTR